MLYSRRFFERDVIVGGVDGHAATMRLSDLDLSPALRGITGEIR